MTVTVVFIKLRYSSHNRRLLLITLWQDNCWSLLLLDLLPIAVWQFVTNALTFNVPVQADSDSVGGLLGFTSAAYVEE